MIHKLGLPTLRSLAVKGVWWSSYFVAPSPPRVPVVLLYTSPTTVRDFSSDGLEAKVDRRQWEVFLRKYKISFQTVTSIVQLKKAPPGVLLLPFAVALSERER